MLLRSHDKVEQQLDKLSKSCTPSTANATTFQGKIGVITIIYINCCDNVVPTVVSYLQSYFRF